MTDSDLMFRGAGELAAMVRSRRDLRARARADLAASASRSSTRCSTRSCRSTPRARSRRPMQIGAGDERPFAGVPIAIKNNRPVKGLRLTYGCSLMAEHVAPYDHNITRRLRDAGFVIVGTTTLPEYGILPVSEARMFGPTRNPWDLQRTPGGSSGRRRRGRRGRPRAGRARQRRRRLDPHPRRVLRPRRAQAGARAHLAGARARRLLAGHRRRAHAHRRRHRRDPRRARRLRARRRDLGAAAVRAVRRAPRPREPGKLRIAATTLAAGARGASVDPAGRARRRPTPPSCCARSATRSRRSTRRGRTTALRELFGVVFSSHIALSIAYSGRVAGREPTAEDMEAMSWAIFSMVGKLGAVE